MAGEILCVDQHDIKLTRTEKMMFPDDGITKREIIEYYHRIGKYMLPHTTDRPLVLHRFPNGIGGKSFFQKEKSRYYPEWIESIQVEKIEDGTVTHAMANNVATLVYLANQACITPHIWLSRAQRLTYPDRMIFDLDPPAPDFAIVRQAGFNLKEILDDIGLPSFPMLTGSKGLHVVVPLDATSEFDEVRTFAQKIADLLVQRNPDAFTTEQRKAKRSGRLFLDVMRNSYAQNAVAPYAVRARPGAPVATPLRWDEIEDPRLTSNRYTIHTIFKRLEQVQDPWQAITQKIASIPESQKYFKKVAA